MPGPVWGEDAPSDEPLPAANVRALLASLAATSVRAVPAVTLVHDWHRAIYAGVSSVPGPQFLGAFRGSAHPHLAAYDVAIADRSGRIHAQTPAAGDVATHLARFEAALHSALAVLDGIIAAGGAPADQAELEAVVSLCAAVHGEWVCIHPYANGNGRTARVWANWAALRYGLPPFVRVKPRPDGLLYGRAASQSMGVPPDFIGDHTLTFSLFLDLLRTRP